MNTAALIPMKWADEMPGDNKTRCACCGKEIKGEPKFFVEVTSDMDQAVAPGLGLDPRDSGGWFPVGTECAKRYLRGFAVSERQYNPLGSTK